MIMFDNIKQWIRRVIQVILKIKIIKTRQCENSTVRVRV